MIIKKIHISSFGKIADADINFKNGLNVFKEKNGFGKTTAAAFIRAMLYGFDYRKLHGADISDAAKYRPWGSDGKFGGFMVFEHDGVLYRVERYFGTAKKQETVILTNENTGKQLPSEGIGERFLGLTAHSFDRSAYFPQEAVEMTSNDNFDARLAGIVDDGADYGKACGALRTFRKNLRYERGDGGILYELEREKRLLDGRLENARAEASKAEKLRADLRNIEEENRRLHNQLAETEKEEAALREKIAEKRRTSDQIQMREQLMQVRMRLAQADPNISKDRKRAEQLLSKLKNVPPSHEKKGISPKIPAVILSVTAVLGIAAAALLFAFSLNVAGAAVTALSAAAVAAETAWLVSTVKKQSDKDAAAAEIKQSEDDFRGIASKYVFLQDGYDAEEVVAVLWEKERQYVRDVAASQVLSECDLPADDGEEERQRLTFCENKRREITERLRIIASDKGRISTELNALCGESPSEAEDKIAANRQRYAREKRRYEVAGKVCELLEQAKENLSVSYLPKLCARCSSLLSAVTNGSYEVTADKSFNVSLREKGVTRPVGEYSRGIKEITLLCFRIALSELLFGGTIPFMMIDDAFVNFDEENFARAVGLMKKNAETGQILYFTCHDRADAFFKTKSQ